MQSMKPWKTAPTWPPVAGLQSVIDVGETIEDCRDNLFGTIEGKADT